MDKWCEQNITEDPLSLEIEKVLRDMQEHEDADIFNQFKSQLRNAIPALPNTYIFELIAILNAEVFRRSCIQNKIEPVLGSFSENQLALYRRMAKEDQIT